MSWRYINEEMRTRQERLLDCFHCHPLGVDCPQEEGPERRKDGFYGEGLCYGLEDVCASSDRCFPDRVGFGEVLTDPVSFGFCWNNGISRRNDRERSRVKLINSSFALLRKHLPGNCWKGFGSRARKLTKVQILRSAIVYIRHLQDILDEEDQRKCNKNNDQVTTAKTKTLITMATTRTTITLNANPGFPPLSPSETELQSDEEE